MYAIQQHSVGPVKDSMSQDSLKDLLRCMHFSDDWDNDRGFDWDSFYADEKEDLKPGTAEHWKTFSQIEDAYNAR